MTDYLVIGMGAAVATFVGGVVATNPDWSDLLTDLSFLILYVCLALCATQVLWSCCTWSTKNPVSMLAAALTGTICVMGIFSLHKNQLANTLIHQGPQLRDSAQNYLISFFQPNQPVAKQVL